MKGTRPLFVDSGWGAILIALAIQSVLSAVTMPRLFSSELQVARANGAGGSAAQMLTLAMAITALGLIVAGLALRRDRRAAWHIISPLLAYCAVYAAVAWSNDGKLRLQYLVVPMFLFAAWALGAPDPDRLAQLARRLLLLIIVGSLLSALVATAWSVDNTYLNPILPGFHFRLYGILYHPNALGGIACAFIALLLTSGGALRWRKLQWLLALLVLFLTFSKTAWIAAAVLIILLIHRRRPAPSRLRQFLVFGAVLTAAIIVLREGASEVVGAPNTLFTGRGGVWAATVVEWRQHPWFGLGPELWGSSMQARYAEALNFTPGQAHSLFLQVLAGTGIVGSIAMTVFLWRVLRVAHPVGIALLLLIIFRGLTEATILPVVSGVETLCLFVMIGVAISGPAEEALNEEAGIDALRAPPALLMREQ